MIRRFARCPDRSQPSKSCSNAGSGRDRRSPAPYVACVPFGDDGAHASSRSRQHCGPSPSSAPAIPYISNVSGTWITPEQATSPDNYAMHLRRAVQFEAGIRRLAEDPALFFLEVGPGNTLSTMARDVPEQATVENTSPRRCRIRKNSGRRPGPSRTGPAMAVGSRRGLARLPRPIRPLDAFRCRLIRSNASGTGWKQRRTGRNTGSRNDGDRGERRGLVLCSVLGAGREGGPWRASMQGIWLLLGAPGTPPDRAGDRSPGRRRYADNGPARAGLSPA